METRRITKAMREAVVADVCLYGTRDIGAGWLVSMNPAYVLDGANTMLGTGEPKMSLGFTEAVYAACDAVREVMGETSFGMVRIYEPSGERMAYAEVNHPGWFGDLKWTKASQYALDVSELVAAQ